MGDYELLDEIARGGMGIVYRARQLSLDRIVAVKVIRVGVLASELDIARFRAEARAAGALRHPAIVGIHEVGAHEDNHYFSMEFVAGRNLGECIRERPWPAHHAAQCLRTIAQAVQHAHDQGILHRDLKPSNVIVDPLGEPHLTDFGLATRVHDSSSLTASGVILGTPSYMAPEQTGRRREEIGASTDVYALGAILYEVLTGRPPFQGESPLDTLQLVRSTEPVPLCRLNPRIPADLETICLKCLEKEPRRRYPTAHDLVADLTRFLEQQPVRARPAASWDRGWKWMRRNPWRAGLAAALALVAFGAISLTFEMSRNRELRTLNRTIDGALRVARTAAEGESRARQQAELAALREAAARKEAERARDDARLASYLRSIPLAQRAWEENNLAQAELLLANCPPEFRHWEWRYLSSLCRPDIGQVSRFTSASTPLSRVAVASDGSFLAAVTGSNRVEILALQPGIDPRVIRAPGNVIRQIAITPGSRAIALAMEGTPRSDLVWLSGLSDEPARVLGNALAQPRALTFLSDDALITSDATGVQRWSATSGDVTWQVPAPEGDVGLGLATSAPGDLVAWITGSAVKSAPQTSTPEPVGNAICILEADSGRLLWRISLGMEEVHSVAISPDLRYLASGHEGLVRTWDLTHRQVRDTVRHGYSPITAVAFTADSLAVVSGSADGTVAVRRMSDPAGLTRQFRGHRGPVLAILPAPASGGTMSVGSDATIRQWEIAQPQEALSIPSDGETMAFIGPDRLMLSNGRVHSTSTGDEVAKIEPARNTHVTASSRAGLVCLSGRCYSTADLERVPGLAADSPRSVGAAAFHHDGELLAIADRQNSVSLWSVPNRTGLGEFKPTTNEQWLIHGLAFSPLTGHLAIATGSWSSNGFQGGGLPGEIVLWDCRRMEPVRTLQTRRYAPWAVAFSPDGTRLVSSGGLYTDTWLRRAGEIAPPASRGEILVWDTTTWAELFQLEGVHDNVFSISFSPDGQRIAGALGRRGSGLPPGMVKVWEMSSGREVMTLTGFHGPVTGVAFSPDGNVLAAVGSRTLRILDAGPASNP